MPKRSLSFATAQLSSTDIIDKFIFPTITKYISDKITYCQVYVKILCYPIPALSEFLFQTHDVQGVQTINNCCTQGHGSKDACTMTPFTDWPQLILSPSIAHVIVPRMFHHLQQKITSVKMLDPTVTL
jgi:hypothetical protein